MPYRVLKQSKNEKRAKPGTVIYGFIGATYGVLGADNKLLAHKHGKYGAFTLGPTPFDYPFFTMPMKDVEPLSPSALQVPKKAANGG